MLGRSVPLSSPARHVVAQTKPQYQHHHNDDGGWCMVLTRKRSFSSTAPGGEPHPTRDQEEKHLKPFFCGEDFWIYFFWTLPARKFPFSPIDDERMCAGGAASQMFCESNEWLAGGVQLCNFGHRKLCSCCCPLFPTAADAGVRFCESSIESSQDQLDEIL